MASVIEHTDEKTNPSGVVASTMPYGYSSEPKKPEPVNYTFSTVVAYDSHRGIGLNGKIPWDLPADRKLFYGLTNRNVVIMGRKTFESIGKYLPGRINVVVSKTLAEDHNTTKKYPDVIVNPNGKYDNSNSEYTEVYFFSDMLECYKFCAGINKEKYVIGGHDIYKWFMDYGVITHEYITEVEGDFKCDTFYPTNPNINRSFQCQPSMKENDLTYRFHKYSYDNTEERKFLFVGHMLLRGAQRGDRTGTGTISLFGNNLKFNLTNDTFPLLTTRKMFLRGIFEELMLYIRGQTNSKILEDKKINVWQGNTSREFLDSRKLHHLPVGDMGPSYGFLFRHFGAKYVDCNTDYKGQGYDQLDNVIHLLKHNPTSRRIIISLWDPSNVDNCPLPPCLYNYQFYVNDGKLSCMMTQRSSDFAVAGGWNVATGALLTYMLAKACDLEPKELIWNIGDTHLYNNVVEKFKEQILREPYLFPKLYLPKKEDLTEYEFTDLHLVNYNYHLAIDFPMNV